MSDDRSRIDARPEVRTIKRRLGIYVCPKCRRRVKRVKQPKRCCGVSLLHLGSVMETISQDERGTPCDSPTST